jgi:hypothetical protein
MARTQKFFIGPQLLGEIRRVVGRVEAEPIGSEISRIPTRLQDIQRPGGAGFRLATFTGSWAINTPHLVTFVNFGGSATATAINHIFGVSSQPGSPCKVGLASEGNTWHLVFVDLTQQNGFASAATDGQLLGHYGGSMKWFDITSCGTATASP